MLKRIIEFVKDRTSFTNYTRMDKKGKFPFSGKIMVAVSDRTSLRFSWAIKSNFHHFDPIVVDPDEGRITTSIGFAPLAFWFSIENHEWTKAISPVRRSSHGPSREGREVRISIHNNKLWWSFWMDPDMQRSDEPKYRRGNFDFADFFFGEQSFAKEVVQGPERVSIPMPEGSYAAESTIFRYTYSRPRFPKKDCKTMAFVTMDPRVDPSFRPIPCPGKGENSYDLGEDALYSSSATVDDNATHEDAIGEVVASALKRRARYGGRNWRPEKVHSPQAAPN